MLNGVSIAEHLRHSYEFYHCLLLGLDTKQLNYEDRARDRAIENNLPYAIERMKKLKSAINFSIKGHCHGIEVKRSAVKPCQHLFRRN